MWKGQTWRPEVSRVHQCYSIILTVHHCNFKRIRWSILLREKNFFTNFFILPFRQPPPQKKDVHYSLETVLPFFKYTCYTTGVPRTVKIIYPDGGTVLAFLRAGSLASAHFFFDSCFLPSWQWHIILTLWNSANIHLDFFEAAPNCS